MSKHSKLAAGLAIAATVAVGSVGSALADGYTAKPAYTAPADWSGIYFGIDSGYQWSSIDVAHVPAGGGIGISSDHDETLVGGHIGVQHQWGALLLGVEGGWQSTLVDRQGNKGFCDTVPGVLAFPLIAPGNNCSARLNDIITIGGRAGWTAFGHWMPYVAGGYANAGFDFNARNPAAFGGGASTLVEQAHTRLGGWYLGGGVEWIVAPMWTAGIEYRHYEFDPGNTTAFSGTTAGGVALETVRFDATTDSVMARVSWRWGREPAAAPLK